MVIQQRNQDDISILEIDGKLVIGEGDVALRDAIQGALDQGFRKIFLDLRKTKTVDSSGLGELVRAKRTVQDAGGQIMITGVSHKVQDVLEMTRLIGIFEEFDSPEHALMETANLH